MQQVLCRRGDEDTIRPVVQGRRIQKLASILDMLKSGIPQNRLPQNREHNGKNNEITVTTDKAKDKEYR